MSPEPNQNKEEYFDVSPKERIINAVRDGDTEALDKVLVSVNGELTGNKAALFQDNDNAIKERAQIISNLIEAYKSGDFSTEEVYLGDGLSRIDICVNGENVEVDLTGNSTELVRKKWDEINKR